MSNRFDNGSISAYTPQSLQELAFTPLIKRQQHDEMSKNLAELNAIATDPLNEHRDEALRLKQELEGKLSNLSGELASKGIDSIGKDAFYKLQKERNDLIAPTGRIGQINAAKIAEAQTKKEFMDSPELKEYGLDAKQKAWEKHRAQYKGYDDKGNIINIGGLSGPKYQDMQKDFMELSSRLGEQTRTLLKNIGAHFEQDPYGAGVIMKTGDGKTIHTDNDPNLKALAETMSAKYLNEQGEGYKSRKFAGYDLKNTLDQLNGMMGIPKVDKDIADMNYSYQHISAPKGSGDGENPEDPNYEGVNVEGVPMTKNSDLLESLNDMKKNDNNSFSYALANSRIGLQGSTHKFMPNQTSNEKTDKILNSQEYLTLARSIQRTQKINVKSLKDPKVQNAVKKYLEENKDVVIQNKYIDPNISKVGKLFASKEISKDKKASSELIMERAKQGAYEVRDIKGNLIPADELGKYNFTYSGDMTSKSQIGNIFTNPKQNIGARRGLLYDPDSKKSIQVYVSRGDDDFETPQWKGMNLINSITKITDTKPGLYHKLKVPALEKFGISNFEVKYNKNSDTYNVSYKDNDGTEVDENPMTDSEFQEYILNTQLH